MARNTDSNGQALKGSQFQIQQYVNIEKYTNILDQEIKSYVPEISKITWVSPIKKEKYKEYSHSFFEPLKFQDSICEYNNFWPKSTAHWDALATVELKGINNEAVLLVEAKSHLNEINSRCKSKNKKNLSTINHSLEETRKWLCVQQNEDIWLNKYYQLSNRLAHLYFITQRRKKKAWLLNIYFINDTTLDKNKQTSQMQWEENILKVEQEMGLSNIPNYLKIIREAIKR